MHLLFVHLDLFHCKLFLFRLHLLLPSHHPHILNGLSGLILKILMQGVQSDLGLARHHCSSICLTLEISCKSDYLRVWRICESSTWQSLCGRVVTLVSLHHHLTRVMTAAHLHLLLPRPILSLFVQAHALYHWFKLALSCAPLEIHAHLVVGVTCRAGIGGGHHFYIKIEGESQQDNYLVLYIYLPSRVRFFDTCY